MQLEARSVRTDRLMEERSRALLGRAFSRVFSHLRNMDPHFDFDAAIAPVPLTPLAATQTAMASPAAPAAARVVLLRMHWGIYPTDCASFLLPYPA